jgi:galactose-1-phosphate uridylyltransferase
MAWYTSDLFWTWLYLYTPFKNQSTKNHYNEDTEIVRHRDARTAGKQSQTETNETIHIALTYPELAPRCLRAVKQVQAGAMPQSNWCYDEMGHRTNS